MGILMLFLQNPNLDLGWFLHFKEQDCIFHLDIMFIRNLGSAIWTEEFLNSKIYAVSVY